MSGVGFCRADRTHATGLWHTPRRRRRWRPGRPTPRDWRDFAAWCASRGATALPAHVGIVAAYLSSLADSGRKASTIGRRAAAIGYHHKMAGHEPPTNSEAVKAVLRGIRRTIGSAKQGKAPATADLIGQMLALCPDTMIGKRDRALLCLGFAGAFRRSELCALEVADLTEVPDGLRILIRRSKGDQEGQGQEVAIPRGYKLRPVEAVQTWLAAAEISAGPVFRAVARGGRVSCEALADDSAARIVKRYARRVGLDAGVLQRPQPAQRVPDQCGGEQRHPRRTSGVCHHQKAIPGPSVERDMGVRSNAHASEQRRQLGSAPMSETSPETALVPPAAIDNRNAQGQELPQVARGALSEQNELAGAARASVSAQNGSDR